ncbi:MAG: ABC transporter ATP-binding protein [Ferruginibacter sp.]
MPALISVNHLSKQFNEIRAVDALSFTVNEGDVYGFLGQNGAGKSTTIRMLLTLVQPSSGDIRIFGKNLSTHRSEILRQVGAVIEKPDLYLFLSAYDNLSIFARMSGLNPSREFLLQQLRQVGLEERAFSKVKTFSQGMKQRLGIATALVHDPALIILDEPVNGLDPQGIADIRNLIRQLSKERGKTILVSSHLLSEIELVANRMLIIHKGKKMVEGDVAQLLDPAHSLVQVDTTDNAAARAQISGTAWQLLLQPGTSRLQFRMNKAEVPQLVQFLIEKNIRVLGVTPVNSLEDYFLSLTTKTGYVEAFAN